MAYIIVFGNEKGGSGKSTTAMHVLTALLRCGFKVGALDLDLRQQTLNRYIENRAEYISKNGTPLPMPQRGVMKSAAELSLPEGDDAKLQAFQKAILGLDESCDFIIVDCAGSHSQLAELAHAMADTLVTPMNDSFVDFDLLAHIDPESNLVTGPSVYSEMVWDARKARAETGARPIEWVVTRNRVGAQNMHNKRKVGAALKDLSRRIGFRIAPGLSDRVVFRELFPHGLTLLDIKDVGGGSLNISNVAARQEVRDLVAELQLPGVEVTF
ncbi:MAG: AAA family ATPase [Rhodobacteraceae bacterium]|nr:AAA family ATPase [Paracoccaceae bacterium]